MKKMTKILCAVMALVLAVGAGVGGTLAWLTSTTEQVVNTVTAVAGLEITLDETKVDEYGVPVDPAERTLANNYKLVPGQIYTKDPTVHVAADSEPCYVFVKVNNGLKNVIGDGVPGPDLNNDGYGDTTMRGLEFQIRNEQGWNGFMTQQNGEVVTIYWKAVNAEDAKKGTDLVVFTDFGIPTDMTHEKLASTKGATITIDAYACQSEGFKDAQSAWNANFAK